MAEIYCPKIDLPEWKALVDKLGEERAYVAFFKHNAASGANVTIPTEAEALGHIERTPSGKVEPGKAKAATFSGLTIKDASDPVALSKRIARYFTPTVIREFVEPFIYKPGMPVFSFNDEAIMQIDAQHAWEDAGGDVMKFADNLFAKVAPEIPLEEGQAPDKKVAAERADTQAGFRISILQRFDDLHLMLSRIAADGDAEHSLFDRNGPLPHRIMDARTNEMIPPDFLKYDSFDESTAHAMLGQVAFHASFGRNAEDADRLIASLTRKLKDSKRVFDEISTHPIAERKELAKAAGYEYSELKKSAQRYNEVQGMKGEFMSLFGNKNPTDIGNFRTGLEAVQMMAGLVVNQPKTALNTLLGMTEFPLAMRGISRTSVGTVARAFGELGHQVTGSLLETAGVHLLRSSEYAKEVGQVMGFNSQNLPWGMVMSDIGRRGDFQNRPMLMVIRKAQAAIRKGIKPGPGQPKEFQRFNFLTAPMHYLATQSIISGATANVRTFELMIKRGMDHFASHPDDLANPSFRFSAEDLKMKTGWWFSDESAFKWYREQASAYGMGNLEDITRTAIKSAQGGQRLISRDQVVQLTSMFSDQVSLESGINSRPAAMRNNPMLRFTMPLLGWPVAQMDMINRTMRTPEGRQSLAAGMKALGVMAGWILPTGLAYTLLTDQYDEKLLRKKSNLRDIDEIAAVPLVGPAIAIARDPRNNTLAMLERMSRAGTAGLAGDLLAGMIVPGIDPTTGMRTFSMDNRILIMSELLGIKDATNNFINQGGQATWQTVGRPLMSSLGGNGPIQAMDIINGFLGLDNAESRVVMRQNVGMILRAAARDVPGIELRKGVPMGAASTPVSMWVREMQTSSMANSRLDFLNAYRNAVEEARADWGDEAEKHVLSSWKARDPMLTTFQGRPTDEEKARIFNVMTPEGKGIVQEAERLYQEYSELIEPSPAEKYFSRQITQMTRPPVSPEQLRRKAAMGMFGGGG